MAQYPIPQFIEEEGKIISFLTFKQFFALVGGGALCAILFYTVPFIVFGISSIFIGFLVAIIAFIKVNNESVASLFMHFIGFSIGKKNYVWNKKDVPVPEIQASRISEIKKTIETKK